MNIFSPGRKMRCILHIACWRWLEVSFQVYLNVRFLVLHLHIYSCLSFCPKRFIGSASVNSESSFSPLHWLLPYRLNASTNLPKSLASFIMVENFFFEGTSSFPVFGFFFFLFDLHGEMFMDDFYGHCLYKLSANSFCWNLVIFSVDVRFCFCEDAVFRDQWSRIKLTE